MTAATAWANLPNAAHIDRIFADLRARPQAWADAWDGTRSAAWGGAWRVAWRVAWGADRGAAYDAAWGATLGFALDAAGTAAWSAALALIAWDDAADVLAMPLPAVRLFVAAGDPRAVLLLPAVITLNPSTEDS